MTYLLSCDPVERSFEKSLLASPHRFRAVSSFLDRLTAYFHLSKTTTTVGRVAGHILNQSALTTCLPMQFFCQNLCSWKLPNHGSRQLLHILGSAQDEWRRKEDEMCITPWSQLGHITEASVSAMLRDVGNVVHDNSSRVGRTCRTASSLLELDNKEL